MVFATSFIILLFALKCQCSPSSAFLIFRTLAHLLTKVLKYSRDCHHRKVKVWTNPHSQPLDNKADMFISALEKHRAPTVAPETCFAFTIRAILRKVRILLKQNRRCVPARWHESMLTVSMAEKAFLSLTSSSSDNVVDSNSTSYPKGNKRKACDTDRSAVSYWDDSASNKNKTRSTSKDPGSSVFSPSLDSRNCNSNAIMLVWRAPISHWSFRKTTTLSERLREKLRPRW